MGELFYCLHCARYQLTTRTTAHGPVSARGRGHDHRSKPPLTSGVVGKAFFRRRVCENPTKSIRHIRRR